MKKTISALLYTALVFFLSSGPASSADFTVSPVNLPFDAKQRTSLLTVKNHAAEKLTLQVTTLRWSQEDGKDVYSETDDIIVFPKIFAVEKGQERIVRVGIKASPSSEEKTYRIYLEEVPPPQDTPSAGAFLRTLLKVGVPVFAAPMKPAAAGRIDSPSLSKGTLSFTVHNIGNTHFTVKTMKITGFDKTASPVFDTKLSGWHILHGKKEEFMATVPAEICTRTANFKIEVTTDILSLSESLNVLPEMCSP